MKFVSYLQLQYPEAPEDLAQGFLEKVQSKYPKAKKTEHKGDSYVIYEAGGRDPLKPFSGDSLKKLIKEDEGPEAGEEDGSGGWSVNLENLDPKPQYQKGLRLNKKDRAENSYPREKTGWQKALSQVEVTMAFMQEVKAKYTLVVARNVVNVEDIDGFVASFDDKIEQRVPDDAVKAGVKKWFRKTLKNWIINEAPAEEFRGSPPKGAPEWLKKAVEEGKELFQVEPRRVKLPAELVGEGYTAKLADGLEHLLDFFGAGNFSDRLSVPDAFKKLVKWTHSKETGISEESKEGPEDVEKIMDLSDGWKVLRLKSEKAFDREGHRMGNCLKLREAGKTYHQKSEKGTAIYLSLRDSKGKPHCVMELTKAKGGVYESEQLKGPKNQPVTDAKALEKAHEFLRKTGAIE